MTDTYSKIRNYDSKSDNHREKLYFDLAIDELKSTHYAELARNIVVDDDIYGVIGIIEELVGASAVRSMMDYPVVVLVFNQLVVRIVRNFGYHTKTKAGASIRFCGDRDHVRQMRSTLKERYPTEKKNSINWFYKADGKVQHTSVMLEHKNVPHDSFYPWIKQGIEQFNKDFLASDANILLLTGDAGTGKSSLIRHLIATHDLSAAVTYDQDLMQMDAFFIEFLNKNYDLLVIEDADVILRDRESGNKTMNKLLNAGDGLVHSKKKIIFTANLTHLDQVDQALIRPGRCFESFVFRELSYNEAKIAALAAGLPEPDGPKTLSELFNAGPQTKSESRMGFSFAK